MLISNVCFILLTLSGSFSDPLYVNIYSIKSFSENKNSMPKESEIFYDTRSSTVKETPKQINDKIIEAKKVCN